MSSTDRRSPTPRVAGTGDRTRSRSPLDDHRPTTYIAHHDDATLLTPQQHLRERPERSAVRTGADAPPRFYVRRVHLLIPCILTLVLAAGPVLGLPALFDTLVHRDMYHDRCVAVLVNATAEGGNATYVVPATCDAQHDALENSADLALSLQSGSALISGVLIDIIGGKWSAVVHGMLWMVAAAAAGLNPEEGQVFVIATTLYAAAGSGWFVSILLHHARYVIPREADYKLVNPLFTGIFNAASLTTLGLRYFFAWQILSLPEAYLAYGLCVGFPLVLFMMWFPSELPPAPIAEATAGGAPTATTSGGAASAMGLGSPMLGGGRTAEATRSRANSTHLARKANDPAVGRSPFDINGTPNHSMQTHVGPDGTRVYRRNRDGLLTDSDASDDEFADGEERKASGRAASVGVGFRSMVARVLGGSKSAADHDDGAAIGGGATGNGAAAVLSDDILFESVDRMGAYGAVGTSQAVTGASLVVAARHDGKDLHRGGGGGRHQQGGGTPAGNRRATAGAPHHALSGNRASSRSRSASPAGGAGGAAGRSMPSTVVATDLVPSDDDEDGAIAADHAQVMMLLKAGSSSGNTRRQRAWARVRLAASASRKIVKQPVYWAVCAHSVATVTVGYFFIANTGSLYRYVGATSSEQSWARDSVAAGIGVFAGLAFAAGVLMRAFGAVNGITAVAACNAASAVVFTALFITVLPGTAEEAASRLGQGLSPYQHVALIIAYAAVLICRILGFALLNLGAPVLFADHPMGVGLALGGALTVGGSTSAGVGRALSNVVHGDPHAAYPPVIAALGCFFVVVEVTFVFAVRRGVAAKERARLTAEEQQAVAAAAPAPGADGPV